MNEAEIIRRSQAGDQDAFRLITDSYSKVLLGTAYLMTHDQGLAEDAVQDALVHAWHGLPSFRPTGSFKAWLLRILINEVNQQQRKRRVQTVPLEEAATASGGADEVEDGALRNEERKLINKALGQLQPDHKEIVVLKYYADLTVPEIAKAVGCMEGTVKSRLHRALSHLGRTLSSGEE